MVQQNRNTIIAEYSQNTPSYVTDNLYNIKKFNKSTFFHFLKVSIAVSVLMSFFFLFGGYYDQFIIMLIASFFGTFAIQTAIFYIERLFNVILNKMKRQKQI